MIVIDLGTNEAFGSKSRESIENDIDNLLFTLRRHHPDAGIVLVSPPECFKKSTRRYKDKKGRWRRKSIKVVNMKVHAIAGIITEYAEKHGIACYNRNILAGGEGAAKKDAGGIAARARRRTLHTERLCTVGPTYRHGIDRDSVGKKYD